VRLAFAVAAHLEPEILVVDEVLAVGDAEFQRKCLGKMGEVARGGRTVLFVSHNMAAVTALTDRSIVLKHGAIIADCETPSATAIYLSHGAEHRSAEYLAPASVSPSPRISRVHTNVPDGGTLRSGAMFCVEIDVDLPEEMSPCVSLQIVNGDGMPVIHCWSYDQVPPRAIQGTVRCTFSIPELSLNVGSYTLTAYLSEPPGGRLFEVLESVCPFRVEVIGRTTLFGWRSSACAYLVDFEFSSEALSSSDGAPNTIPAETPDAAGGHAENFSALPRGDT